MKKILIMLLMLLMSTALVVAFAGCGGSSEEAQTEEPAAAEEDGQLSGGWTVYADSSAVELPEPVKTAFEKATENLVGNEFTPLAYMSKQVVAGKNYQILCKSVMTTSDPEPSLQVLVVYMDLDGRAEVSNITDFEIGTYTDNSGADVGEAHLAGGWEVAEDYTKGELPEEVKAVYEKAIQQIDGSNFTPMAYLGSQVVAGTNYAVMVEDETTAEEPVRNIQVLTIYEDLNGKVELSNICTLLPAEFAERPDGAEDGGDDQ